MPTTRTLKLLQPIKAPEGDTLEVTLREPTAEEFFELGEPRSTVWSGDPTTAKLKTAGQTLEMKTVENGVALKKYMERCIVKPNFLLVMAQVSLADAMRIKEEFLLFFDLALAATSEPPATSLSSISSSAGRESADGSISLK
jgi:hypothetical protein